MARVDPREYGSGDQRPKLTPEVLGGVDTAALTILETHMGIRTGDGRLAANLNFAEHPDHAYWLNKTDISALVERLGDDDADWIGKKVPLIRVRVTNPRTEATVEKLHVAPIEEWDEILLDGARS